MRIRITEYLDIDLERETWCCNRCGCQLYSARDSYKKGCVLLERDPKSVYPPVIEESFTFSPDSTWVSIIEFYCPNCGTMIDNEFLPPGHPITHDIELDVDALKERNGTEAQ